MHQAVRRVALGLVIAVLAAGTARPCAGQSLGRFVGPIDSGTFDSWIERLRPSHAARVRAEARHETDKSEYRAFRDGPQAEFLARVEAGTDGEPIEDDALRDLLERQTELTDRLRAMDERLFAGLREIFDDARRAEIARIERSRAREYVEFFLLSRAGETKVDLAAFVDALGLEPTERAAVEPIVAGYQVAINAALADLQAASTEATFVLREVLMATGPTAGAESDPAMEREMGAVLQEVHGRTGKDFGEAEDRVVSVTRDAAERIAAALPPEDAARFRAMVRRRTFPRLYPDRTSPERLFQALLESEAVDARTRENVRALAASHRAQTDAINRRLEALVDEERRHNPTFGRDRAWWDEHERELKRLLDRRKAINERTAEATLALLDVTTAARVRDLRGPALHGGRPGRRTADPTVTAAEEIPGEVALPAEGPIPPRAIEPDEFRSILDRLGIEGDGKAIAPLHFRDYRSEIERASMPKADEGGDDDRIDRWRAAMEATARADRRLFDRLAPLVPTDRAGPLEDARRSRERARLEDAQDRWDRWPDLVEVARRVRMTPRAWAALAACEREALPRLKARVEATIDRRRAVDEWRAARRDAIASGEADRERLAAAEEAVRKARARERRLARELFDEAVRHAEAVEVALPEDEARRFRAAFRRAAYPEAYPDPHDATPVLREALALADLTEERRAKIDALLAEHAREHRRLTEALQRVTKITDRFGVTWADPPEVGERMRSDHLERERLLFDRREWNATVVRRARAILTAEQAARVPGLD